MASAAFTINGSTVPAAVSVAFGGPVALALLSTTGVQSISWSIAGSSAPTLTNPTITPAGAPSGATATCTHCADPGTGSGAAFLVRCTVTDSKGATFAQYGVFGTASSAGIIPATSGEKLARHATHGWLACINTPVASPPAPIGLTAGIGITLASVVDPGVPPGAGSSRLRSKTDATDGDVLMVENSTEDRRVLTSDRLVGGARVTDIGGSCTTTDNTTWLVLLNLPIRGLVVGTYYEAEIVNQRNACRAKLWGSRSTAGVLSTTYLQPPNTALTSSHSYIQVVDPGSGSYVQVQVKGLVVETENWIGHATIVGETV